MSPDSIGERYYKDTVESILRLENYLSDSKAPPTYPDRNTLIVTVIRICQMMRAALENERASCSSSPDFDLFQLCDTYNKHLQDLEEDILDAIPLIDPFAQPSEIIEPIKANIRGFAESFALIIRSDSKDNYEINTFEDIYKYYVDIFSPYVPIEYRVFELAPKWLIFLSFPRIHSRDVLRHVITISHEMLHLKDHILGITNSLLNEIRISAGDIQSLVEQIRTEQIRGESSSSPQLTMEDFYTRHEIERVTKEICSKILENWLKEIVADLLATRYFGPAFFFSLAHFSLSLGVMDHYSISHPRSRLRLRMILEVLRKLGYTNRRVPIIFSELGKWKRYLDDNISPTCIPPEYESHCNIAESKVLEAETTIMTKVENVTQDKIYSVSLFMNEVPKLIELLSNGISPAEIREERRIRAASLAAILNAGHIFFLAHLKRIRLILGSGDSHLVISKLNDLLLHAIQTSTILQQWLQLQHKQYITLANKKDSDDIERKEKMGAPSAIDLQNRIFAPNINDRLIITPQLEIDYEDSTIDLHLGTKFLLFRLTRHGTIDPSKITEEEAHELLEKQQLRIGEQLTLHPRQLLLASTLEYVSIPQDLGASVITRSSYGSLGLITATSIFVHPGFKGCLTLELTNVGNSPIILRPLERIAQLVFEYHVPSNKPFISKYLLATGPEFPKMWKDRDRELLKQLGDHS